MKCNLFCFLQIVFAPSWYHIFPLSHFFHESLFSCWPQVCEVQGCSPACIPSTWFCGGHGNTDRLFLIIVVTIPPVLHITEQNTSFQVGWKASCRKSVLINGSLSSRQPCRVTQQCCLLGILLFLLIKIDICFIVCSVQAALSYIYSSPQRERDFILLSSFNISFKNLKANFHFWCFHLINWLLNTCNAIID